MFNQDLPWATIGVWFLTLIVALVGGAVVIWGDPGALSFEKYATILAGFAGAHGLLGIGRGVKAGLENHAAASSQLSDAALLADLPDSGSDAGEARQRSAPPSGGHV